VPVVQIPNRGRAFPGGAGSANGARPQPPGATAPRASRLTRPSWLDLRLITGVALVMLAVLGGARVVTAAGHTTPVWALRHDLVQGSVVGAGDVVPAAVHFDSTAGAQQYLSAGVALPAGVRLARSVAAGELLPRAALHAAGPATVSLLPLGLTSGNVPPGLGVGTLVDVWAVPGPSAGAATTRQSPAVEVLAGVPVSAVSGTGSFGATGTTVVTVSIPRDGGVGAVLSGVAGKSVVLLPVSHAVDTGPAAADQLRHPSTASPRPVVPSTAGGGR